MYVDNNVCCKDDVIKLHCVMHVSVYCPTYPTGSGGDLIGIKSIRETFMITNPLGKVGHNDS